MLVNTKNAKSTQVQSKAAGTPAKQRPCQWLCNLVPTNVPGPDAAQSVLHPQKDVFVLKVAKVGPNGDRHCKMELELVTPKGPRKKPPVRLDTRDAQCDQDPPTCCCMKPKKKKEINR